MFLTGGWAPESRTETEGFQEAFLSQTSSME